MCNDLTKLAREFEVALLDDYMVAKRELNYHANYYHQMILDLGGLQTAKKLLSKSGGTYGLERLWQEDRLDLSMEARILDPRFAPLFGKEELDTARRVLTDFGYEP